MLDKIKRLGTDTAVYGISTILGRFLNYLLTPFYTNVLLPSEYGIVTYIYSLIAFVNVVYNYGMESAFFKYYSSGEIGTKKQSFSIPFLSILVTSAGFTVIIFLLKPWINALLHIPPNLDSVIPYTAGILAFDALAIIPFAALRMERKSKTFAFIKLGNIVINVAMNIILLVVLHLGVEGIFISALCSSVITFVMLFPTIARHLEVEYNGTLLRALLKFGLPFVPAGLATAAIQVIDRPILRGLTDDATVGIYQANYRMGIFMMLIVSMYDYAWRPFYFSIAKEPDAKRIFSRVLTYLLLFMAGIFLVLTLFIENVVKITVHGHSFIHPSYWSGLNIVPVVLLGYVFLGVSTNLSAGIYIQKKTHLMPPITFVGALVNIAANFLLIPVMGILGAAWATFLAYFIMAVMLYFVVQRVYPVEYEFGRIGKIILATALIYAAYFFYQPPWGKSVYKVILSAVFLLLMYMMKFFDQRELNIIKGLLKRAPASAVKETLKTPAEPPDAADPASGLGS